ncbi:iron permease [Aminipila butyrica]|uniref:Iron permease n=1 Tax=Aminipila butyrica TaxID=433296 RepID=A0A858C0K3_9FIRM|nr:FTR1 family protein [Aminipila butyrica]QIB69916.1 iron permease [Aminipila butyrica]
MRKILVPVLSMMMILISMFPTMAFAETAEKSAAEPYYATWDEYKESGQPASTWNDVVDAMEVVLETGKARYAAGDTRGAYDSINNGYYGYYETTGFERIAMGYISGSRKTEMELQFSACKAVTKNGGSTDEFNKEVDLLASMLREDAHVLDGTTGSNNASNNSGASAAGGSSAAVATFAACFSIMLREGFEAILIVGAIVAYLVKSAGDDIGRRKRLVTPIYVGSIVGIVASFVLAWLLNLLKLANSASQEVIEGVTALLAVCVLFYVSNWMLSKSETDSWTSYIKTKTEKSSLLGSTFALTFTAFLAVFREGAEVVLFYQPMLSNNNVGSVWAGFIIGCICLVFVYLAIHFLSIKIPIKPFFTATGVLMSLMSISFLGAGIKELIEGDIITMSSPDWLAWIPTNDILDVLGIYPTLQTLIPQLILLVIAIILFVIQTKKNHAIHLEAEKKRAEERILREAEEKKAKHEALKAEVRGILEELLAEKDSTAHS